MSFNEFIQWLRGLFNRNQQVDAVSPTQPVEPINPTTEPASTPTGSGTTDEPTTPVEPPTIITPPEPVAPKIIAIDTDGNKVAIQQEIAFQITTTPFGQYEGCKLDLSETRNVSLIQDIDANGRFVLKFNEASSSDNDIQTIRVSNPDSSMDKPVTASLMQLFWNNHAGRKNICDETLFTNQCAIRMGAALELSGIIIPVDRRILRRCTTEYRAYKHHKQGLVNGHILAAQELANWIKSQTSTFGQRSIVHSKEELLGRSGIIFFRDGWGTTDHIDVWDGENLVGGFPSYFDSDFKELWFWDIY